MWTANEDSKTANSWEGTIIDSKQPRLRAFGKHALWITSAIVLINFVTLIGAFFFFHTRCHNVTEVFPNSLTTSETDTLTDLKNRRGVTIKTVYLIVYSSTGTYPLLNGTYWEPKAVTCGCGAGGDCQLASCSGTNPVYVTYDSCTPGFESFSLASGLVIYIDAAVSIIIVMILWAIRVGEVDMASMGRIVLAELIQPL